MSIKVECQCGQRFSAPDSLAGKRVKCPQCASPIRIPGAKTSSRPSGSGARAASQPLTSSNDIFAVEDLGALEGHHDPLGLESQSSASTLPSGAAPQVRSGLQHNPYAQQPVAAKGVSSGLVIGLAAGGGALVLLLIVAVVVGTMMMGGSDRTDVSQNDGVPQRPTARVEQPQGNRGTMGAGQLAGSPLKGNGTGTAGGGSDETDDNNGSDATTPVSTDGNPKTSPQLASISTLAKVTPNWAFAANAKRAGTRKAGDGELVILHYSWMVELLPELGHQKVYDRFNFEKSWTEPENQVVCHELIPQFLNPLDSRERLEDPRFPAFAVTHFAGMSGVEDLPNDRAAEWARAHPAAGVFGYHDMARPKDISDGTSNTIMIVGTGRIVEPWAIGGGATVRGAREPLFGKFNGLGSVGLPEPGVIVVMADGSIRHISHSIDPTVFKAMCTIHGAEQVDLNAAGISQIQEDWFAQ